jgi:DNA repair protein RecO (recombination protein O)
VATTTCEALVLRSVDFGESDRIVHLLVPDSGRLTAIAKGARRSVRRFPGTLDLFNHLRVQVERRRTAGMARLEQATLLEVFTPLRSDPARFALGCYLLELFDRLAPEGIARADAQRLFAFALAGLRLVAAPKPPDPRLRTLLELRALDVLGLCPELRRCVRCGAACGDGSAQIDFAVADGGPVCPGCRRPGEALESVHLGTLRALDHGLRLPLEQLGRLILSRQALAESRRLLDRFQRFHTGVELRSERFLEQLLGVAT